MRKVLVIQRGCIAAYSVICNTLNCLQLEPESTKCQLKKQTEIKINRK